MIDIRQPNITAATEREQLLQMRSYLYQLSQQLNWAFSTISSGNGGGSTVQQQVRTTPVNKAQEAQANFAEIKALIIKSADIVNAYSDIIQQKLEGQYVAASDFGVYREQTEQTITETSQAVMQNFNNIQTIQAAQENTELSVQNLSGDVQTLMVRVDALQEREANAWIKTGLLEEKEDGTPVYGLEIGQINTVNGEEVFNKFARFTADRLSFYNENDTEAAYISDYTMYITDVVIQGKIEAGGYRVLTNRGWAWKWIGG